MNKTSIEWTDFTWNPIRARNTRANRTGTFCTRISPGCKNCYASVINRRFGTGLEYDAQELKHHEFFLSETILAEPLKRQKPARIFVGDMFDLFHEAIPAELIAEVLRVALKTPRHTFQFLTKRAERMRTLVNRAQEHWGVTFGDHMHFGVSIEDQKRADERVPLLLTTKIAVRFLSVEPQLEAIDLDGEDVGTAHALGCGDPSHRERNDGDCRGVDWVICGGESGLGARPFNLAWAESLLAQCRAAGVPFFMKQLGSRPQVHSCRDESCTHPDCGMEDVRQRDRKGGDPAEWPEALRVREFPALKSKAVLA